MRAEIICGVGMDRNNQAIATEEAIATVKTIIERASRTFGGCNVRRIDGGWIDDHGQLVVEAGGVFTIDGVKAEQLPQVEALAAFIKDILRQSSVVLNTYVVNTSFL